VKPTFYCIDTEKKPEWTEVRCSHLSTSSGCCSSASDMFEAVPELQIM